MPSIGQIIPHNMINGKNEPKAMYVADRSLSTAHDITKPLEEGKKVKK